MKKILLLSILLASLGTLHADCGGCGSESNKPDNTYSSETSSFKSPLLKMEKGQIEKADKITQKFHKDMKKLKNNYRKKLDKVFKDDEVTAVYMSTTSKYDHKKRKKRYNKKSCCSTK